MTNKFFSGQRISLAVPPSDLLCLGTPLSAAEMLTPETVYHLSEYVNDLNGEKMITLQETGSTQYLERLFFAAKRKRTEAVRVKPKRSLSMPQKV